MTISMLKLLWMPRQASRKDLWKDFDPTRQLWVVSENQTKAFLNRKLLESTDVVSEPVKRAKELWKELLAQVEPEFKVLEELGTEISAKEYLAQYGESDWCKRPRAAHKLLEACRQLGPLISSDLAPEVLEQFEEQFKIAGAPFLEISRLAAGFYLQCMAEKQAPHFLVPYILSRRDELPEVEKNLIFDMGFDLRHGERELIQVLSKTWDISMVIPAADEKELDHKGLLNYKNFDLGLALSSREVIRSLDENTPTIGLWRCSSPEAEARQAVEQVRAWVAQGVKAHSICITAPRIADYEDILSHDLSWEGLGITRSLTAPLSAGRLFRALSARLRIIGGELNSQILDEAFLTVATYRKQIQRRDELRTLKPVARPSQITQEELQKKVSELRSLRPRGRIQIRKFEDIVMRIFKDLVEGRDDSFFAKSLLALRYEIGHRELEFSTWIEAWQDITSNTAIEFQTASTDGIFTVDLSSCEEVPAKHLIILGCTENKSHGQILNGLDQEKMEFLLQLGFDLAPPLRIKNDNLISWLMSGIKDEIVLSCPKTDSRGRAVGASPLWIKLATNQKRNLDYLNSARDTQWVHLQEKILEPDAAPVIAAFKKWPEKKVSEISNLILTELYKTRVVRLEPQTSFSQSVSASQLEAYWECPYKFFARGHLRLFDEDDLELEPSPLAKGQWIHSAVEKIMKDKRGLMTWSEKDLSDLIDGLDEVQKQISSEIWPNIRARFLRQLNRFIAAESQWQQSYPRSKPTLFEASLEGFLTWNENEQKLGFQKTQSSDPHVYSIPFRGRIDRIDQTAENKSILIDYKSGSGVANHIASWAKKGSFQLGLYAQAMEAGFLKDGPTSVVAAQYYVLKNLKRDKGFWLSDENLSGVLPVGKSKAAVDKESRNKHFNDIQVQVHGVLENIRKGEMTPNPQDEELCGRCSWRTSCRAPHLD